MDENEIAQISNDAFLYTFPSGWCRVWGSNYKSNFRKLDIPETLEGPKFDAQTLNMIRTVVSNTIGSINNKCLSDICLTPTMICFGGSFDGLHPGHISTLNDLIQLTIRSPSNKLIAIAISDDAALHAKDPSGLVIPFTYRRRQVTGCLTFLLNLVNFKKTLEVRCDKKLLCIPLNVSPRIRTALRIITSGWNTIIALFERQSTSLTFAITDLDKEGVGSAAELGDLEIALVTQETMAGGQKLNKVRKNHGLPALHLLLAPLLWPVETLLAGYGAQIDQKISSRFHRAEFENCWFADHFAENKLDAPTSQAAQRRESFNKLCETMGLTSAQRRVLLRCLVCPVLLYTSPQFTRTDWKVPAHQSVCSDQDDLESEFPDSGLTALRAADDFVALFLEDEASAPIKQHTSEDSTNMEVPISSRGVRLLECIKGNE